jgi:hypothetical protein
MGGGKELDGDEGRGRSALMDIKTGDSSGTSGSTSPLGGVPAGGGLVFAGRKRGTSFALDARRASRAGTSRPAEVRANPIAFEIEGGSATPLPARIWSGLSLLLRALLWDGSRTLLSLGSFRRDCTGREASPIVFIAAATFRSTRPSRS